MARLASWACLLGCASVLLLQGCGASERSRGTPVPREAGTFRVTRGSGCEARGRCLVSSRRRRFSHLPTEGCSALVDGAFPLAVRDFETEGLFDRLVVNSRPYWGKTGPEGVVATGEIVWFTRRDANSSWRICTTGTVTTSTATTSTSTTALYKAFEEPLAMPLAAAASVLLVLLAPVVFWMLGAPGCVALDVLVSSLDIASDLFWVLAGDFHGRGTQAAAAACLVAGSLVFVLCFFGPGMVERPLRWGEQAAKRLRSVAAWLSELWFLFAGQELCFLLDNEAVSCVLVVLLAPLALLPSLAAALLAVTMLMAALTWVLAMLLLGLLLHATRLLVAERPLGAYRHLLGANCAAAEAGVAAGEAVSLRLWNYLVVSELLLETAPSLAVRLLDAQLRGQGLDALGGPRALALCCSVLALARLGLRLLYFTAYKGQELGSAGWPGTAGAASASAAVEVEPSAADPEANAVVAGTIVGSSVAGTADTGAEACAVPAVSCTAVEVPAA